jgi:hypothetical protein
MGRVQATRMIFSDRPLLGQMAIATVLVGGAAALSSAGIAVPVSKIDYTTGADRRAASPSTPALRIAAPAGLPAFAAMPAPRIDLPAPRAVLDLAEFAAPMSRPAAVLAPDLVAAPAKEIVLTPGPGQLAPLPLETPVTLIVVPAQPAAPSAATASLAVAVPAVEAAPSVAAEQAPSAVPFRLVNPPELRGFDLAQMGALPKAVPAGFAKVAAKSPISGKVEGLGKKDTVVGDAVFHQVSVSVAGSDGTAIDVRIGADMKPSIKVGDLLALVADQMDPDSAARFAAASSAGDYVSLATLRAAGFDVAYNAGADRISISAAQ